MNSGLGKSISYWAKNNPKQIWWLLLALAASLFRGQILMEMIAVVIISIRTVDVFNVMTYSLPFSMALFIVASEHMVKVPNCLFIPSRREARFTVSPIIV